MHGVTREARPPSPHGAHVPGSVRGGAFLSAVRSGMRPEIASVSTIMLLLTLIALAIVAFVLRRAGDSATQIARTMTGG